MNLSGNAPLLPDLPEMGRCATAAQAPPAPRATPPCIPALVRLRRWRIMYRMVIIETPLFTRIIGELMSDDAYRQLQEALIQRPEKGDLIPGSGGLRKVRWKLEGQGQRGGVRIIYYWVATDEQLRMLYAYAKSQQENLTPDQLAALRKIVERWTS